MTFLRQHLRHGVLLVAVLPLAACQFTGVNSTELPFAKGGGSDAFRITVEMASVANLVPNSEVKVDEVTVGSVRKVELDDQWHARVTIGLEKGTDLPRNVVATVAQKSLLGAEYVELSSPDQPSSARLKGGDTIGLASTGRYPETEETLSAVSLLLNGGGLSQLQTITHELNKALGGREEDIKAFITEFGTLAGDLADQRKGIVQALNSLDRLSARYASGDDQIKTALADIPAGVDTLASERARLTSLLTSLGDLGTQVDALVTESGDNLRADATHLARTLDGIANTGTKDFQTAIGSLTYPFPMSSVIGGLKGDYLNLFFTVDLSLKGIERDYMGGTPLAGLYSTLVGLIPGSASAPASNPLLDPLAGLLGKSVPGGNLGGKHATTGTQTTSVPAGQSTPVGGLLSGLLGGGH